MTLDREDRGLRAWSKSMAKYYYHYHHHVCQLRFIHEGISNLVENVGDAMLPSDFPSVMRLGPPLHGKEGKVITYSAVIRL